MKPASSAKRAKRAKAAANAAKSSRFSRSPKSKGGTKTAAAPKSAGSPKSQSWQSFRPDVEGAIAHARPTMGRQELQAAAQLLRVGAIGPGPEVSQLENEFCKFLGLPSGHAVAVCSGTAALYLALWVLEARDKTVAMPVYASASLRSAARLAGAGEHLVDTADGHVHIDLAAATGSGADIAVVPHLFGLPAQIVALKNMRVIEDCSEGLGAKIGDTYVGLLGEIGVYSFAATRIITTGGQGGMLVSRNRAHIDKVRNYRQFNGDHDGQPHFNFTMTDLQAAIGRVQLAKLPNFLARREEIFAEYKGAGFDLFDSGDQAVTPVRYRAVIRTERPQQIVDYLTRGMIETIVPISEQALLGPAEQFPNAAKLSRSTVCIPIYPHLSNAEVAEIVEQVEMALAWSASSSN
jgi:perosamine synthetase